MNSAHTFLTLHSHGWDTLTEQDVELPSVYVSIWVQDGGSSARQLEHECKSPQELWGLVRALNKDRGKTLQETFNYRERKHVSVIPSNLGDLFK